MQLVATSPNALIINHSHIESLMKFGQTRETENVVSGTFTKKRGNFVSETNRVPDSASNVIRKIKTKTPPKRRRFLKL